MAAPQQQQQQQQAPPAGPPLNLLQAQAGAPPPAAAAPPASSSSSAGSSSSSSSSSSSAPPPPPPTGGSLPGGGPPSNAAASSSSSSSSSAAASVAPSVAASVVAASVAAAQAQDFDPVQRFRLLLPQLKESLQNLMKVAAQNFLQNTNIDSGQKSNDGPVQRVDKSLEEFYALCDQLELCLRVAYECLSQSFDSAKHSPTLVPTATKPDAVQTESLPYTQYLSMIKSQIACAKDIHNALLECSNKITGKVPSQGVL